MELRDDRSVVIRIGFSAKLKDLRCDECGGEVTATYGVRSGRVMELPMLGWPVTLQLARRRVRCPRCGIRLHWVAFVGEGGRCTVQLQQQVVRDASRMTITSAAELLGLDWKMVKRIDKAALQARYDDELRDGVRVIGVDEISRRKGHKYFTEVYDLERRRLIWVGRGRSESTMDAFYRALGPAGTAQIRAVVCDMWAPFHASTRRHAPQAVIVLGRFHVEQMYSRMLTSLRASEYRAADAQWKQVLRGAKYLLLSNEGRLNLGQRARLDELLAVNQPLALAYILKDALKRLWDTVDVDDARRRLQEWVEMAMSSQVKAIAEFGAMLLHHRDGIVAHALYPLSTGLIEGFNNKIKVIKRMAYGFRDDISFMLKMRQACDRPPMTFNYAATS